MRVLVIGASGHVGMLVVQGALARPPPTQSHADKYATTGHKVTALVRGQTSLACITVAFEMLTIVKGRSQDKADVKRTFVAVTEEAPNAVTVTLQATIPSPNRPHHQRLYTMLT